MFNVLSRLSVLPIVLSLIGLACEGTVLTETPTYTCPTDIPPLVAPGTPAPPAPTPYTIQAPLNFYVGDAIFVGRSADAQAARFRLTQVTAQPTDPDPEGQPQAVYSWHLQIKNIGRDDYTVFPVFQMNLISVHTAYGDEEGLWSASRAAATEVGFGLETDLYTLSSGETRTFRLATIAPAGQAQLFAFQLDPTSVETTTIQWINQTNPHCDGDIADP